MKTHFPMLAAVLVVALVLSPVLAVKGQAQEIGTNTTTATAPASTPDSSDSAPGASVIATTDTPAPDTPPEGIQIDQATRLVNAEWNPDDGTVTVTLYSATIQDIVISDAGAFQTGGVVKQREITIRPDQTVQITMPVTRTEDGYVGVSIATRNVLYAVPIEAPRDISPFDKVPPAAGWFGGASAMAVGVIGASIYVRRKEPDTPEVIE